MGCTVDLAIKSFNEWLEQKISTIEDLSNKIDTIDRTILHEFNKLSWDDWCQRVPMILRTDYDLEDDENEINKRMRHWADSSWLWIDGHDSLISLRGILEAAEGFERLSLDIGELVDGGWIDANEQICLHSAALVSTRGTPTGPVIVLAEGNSDIEVLKASLPVFHPDLTEFITFLDHREFNVDGGVGFVVKFLKAFAAARVPTNVVAVVDNDAAGLKAFKETKALNLPDNMVCIHLPDIEIARNYPTVGPQGNHPMDINGSACSIEMYMGRSSLVVNSVLSPVLWNGRDGKYWQGAVENKDAIRTQFLKSIRNNSVNAHRDFPEMALIWDEILKAAKNNASSAQERAKPPLPY